MTRILSEGFEGGDLLGYVVSGGANSASNPRSGGRCLQLPSSNTYIQKIFASALSELYIRVAVRPTTLVAASDVLRFLTGTTVIGHLQLNTDGSMTYYSGAGAGTPLFTTAVLLASAANYVLVELYLKISDTVGVVTLKMDGIQRGTFAGDTKPTADTTIDRMELGLANGTYSFDDWGINDTAGGADNSWLGDGHIITQLPTGAGNSTQWTPSTGANWENVDEVPPDGDTTYNSTATTNQRDDYALANSGLSGVTISRVWVEMVTKIDVADGSTAGMYIRAGTTNYDDANGLLAQTLSYVRYKSAEWLVNPDTTVAWTVGGLDALTAGVRT